MDNKTMALVSYIFTPIGWLISFFSYKGQAKDSLVSYHLRQSFGLFLLSLVAIIVVWILFFVIGMMSTALLITVSIIIHICPLVFLTLMFIGIINAAKGEERPIPMIGKMFEGKFNFIP